MPDFNMQIVNVFHIHVYVRLYVPVHVGSHYVYMYVLELQKWKSPTIFLKNLLLYYLLLNILSVYVTIIIIYNILFLFYFIIHFF